MSRIVCWYSCGAASTVATLLTLRAYRDVPEPRHEVVIAYCETGSEHPDNAAYLAECEKKFRQPIIRLRGAFKDTWEVWEKRRYLSGIAGAPCTFEMKVGPRLDFQLPSDFHVFGYTADGEDVARSNRMKVTYPEMKQMFPLIEAGLTKASVIAMVKGIGLPVPPMYALGFQNNNCIPCVKATSPAYWALVRKEFPEQFERMAKLSRELGARLARLNDERVFIDEIPLDHPTTNPIAPACDFLCHIAEQDIGEAA